ncbi:N-terminal binuclear Zn cluster-containing protein [Trichoderma citrinoviride]|uniref:N-terminal binuclear Zn cluster-containing protein n=1 Tax=Trichoderma citrinoviride TaxID=58853 RepID=A0A2T4BLW8_9HYPO|nr:N-terminal binuclear Zn cluster-containing protein [Trichoderma citrinoviride]PTB70308.1 N-terminal binuclear Zn cluster-containing protein [Trichoderma citrinoviride]
MEQLQDPDPDQDQDTLTPAPEAQAAPQPAVQPQQAQPQAQKGRIRAKKACIECRRRKRKCDGVFPCSMCTHYQYNCGFDGEIVTSGQQQKRPHEALLEPGEGSQNVSETPEDISRPSPLIRGIIEPKKRRYMNQNSAVAFPNQLGVELESAHPPRLHSFAWNCGIRPEEPGSIHAPLTDYVTWEECRHYADIYFATVDVPFHLFDKDKFLQQCDTYFNRRNQDLILGALIGAVVSLGSLFAFREGHHLEPQIVKHVKDVLEDSTFSRIPSIDQVNAWILRTLYLRSTTRPHLTWLASCTVMHLVEAVGLHRDLESDLVTQSGETRATEDEGSKRTFWLAWCINTIIAYEYGRTKIHFDGEDSRPTPFNDRSETGLQIRMARILPSENVNADAVTVSKSLEGAIQKLLDLGDVKGFPALTRGDLCFCLYRRLRLLKISISKDTLSHILQIGQSAVEAAYDLAQRGVPWWNVLGTTFQFFCVLLAIDNRDSLTQVSWVLSRLDGIVQILNTHMAFEALETARTLMRDLLVKKRQEVALLEMSEGSDIPFSNRELTPDWDMMLNPYYTVGGFNFKDLGV